MIFKISKYWGILILGLSISSTLFSQTKEELQKQEEQYRKEIQELTIKLNKTQQNKSNSLAQINLIKQKISTRQYLRNKINQQLNLINKQIEQSTTKIGDLNQKLYLLKQEYAQTIDFMYRNRSNFGIWYFILAANDFNESFKRMYYLKRYQNYQLNLKASIENNTESLVIKMENLNQIKKKRQEKISVSNKELDLLNKDKATEDQLYKNLIGEEAQLKEALEKKEKQRIKMKQLIKDIIKKETLEAAAKRDKTKNHTNKPNTATTVESDNSGLIKLKEQRPYSPLEQSADDIEFSLNFEKNKGDLPWPVDKGNIDVPFGVSLIPNTKLSRKSDGLEISVPLNSTIKNIADGIVLKASEFGGEFVVMILHGKYISVYSHLASVNVKAGQELKARAIIGKSGKDINGEGFLLFMITNDKGTPLNPELWLKKRIN